MRAVKKSVSFDPIVLRAMESYRMKLIVDQMRPISFSEALNDLLRDALEDIGTMKEGVAKCERRECEDAGR